MLARAQGRMLRSPRRPFQEAARHGRLRRRACELGRHMPASVAAQALAAGARHGRRGRAGRRGVIILQTQNARYWCGFLAALLAR